MEKNIHATTNHTVQTKERDITIDILKGIAIVLVVLGHVISGIYDTEHFSENILFKICYSFHMPLFVFISGWLNGLKPLEKIDGAWIKNRTLRLMIPYGIWTLGKWFLYRESLGNPLKSLFVEPLFWFIIFIYICSCFVFLSNKAGNVYIGMVLAYGVILAAGVLWPENLLFRNLRQFYPFYVLGFFGSNLRSYWKKYDYLQRYQWMSLVLYPLSMLVYSYGGEEEKMHRIVQNLHIESVERYLTILWKVFNKYGVAVLGIWFSFTVISWGVRQEKCRSLQRIFAFMGLYTIQIYLLHDFFFIRRFDNRLLNGIASFVVSLTISLVISLLVKMCPKLSKTLFGQ